MDPTAAGELAAQLPSLWPDAASIVALTQPLSPPSWSVLRRDPGALVLLLGHGACSGRPLSSPLFSDSTALFVHAMRSALALLERGEGCWLDWRRHQSLPAYRVAVTTAQLASLLASASGRVDPDAAWVAGMLAPLGWFAIAAASPNHVASGVEGVSGNPSANETRRFPSEIEQGAIARRLARKWLFPDWLRVTIGHLALPLQAAVNMGADANLFAIVQAAAVLAEKTESPIGLTTGVRLEEAAEHLGLRSDDMNEVMAKFRDLDAGDLFTDERLDPRTLPFLPRMLRNAIEQAHHRPCVSRSLERDIDRLHVSIVNFHARRDDDIREAKLAALAEFAAGASHEINNPLAVISGQAQYLLQGEADRKRQEALRSIVRQVQRIHGILTDLMQFARPARPNATLLSIGALARAVADELRASAGARAVQLDVDLPDAGAAATGDAKQIHTALTCLVRNAVEAAPTGGWVRVAASQRPDGTVEVSVEDNGPGPSPAHREHIFDPFYSGRTAGRGRGLGLPTAWRLARENGGDVRLVTGGDGPTRFVLTLPASAAQKRMSA